MNYEEMKGLEEYVAQAKIALDEYRIERERVIRANDERRERERVEKWDALSLSLTEIIPPELSPLWSVDTTAEPPRSYLDLPLVYDGREILGLRVHIGANMRATFNDLRVPDARLCEREDGGQVAVLTFEQWSGPLVEETEGTGSFGADSWQLATAKAFEVLAALRDYERRALEHNANLDAQSAQRLAEREQREAEQETSAPAPENFVLLEYDDLFAFSNAVNRHREQGYALHGPSRVVMHDDPEYPGRLIPVYYQAVVLPEAF